MWSSSGWNEQWAVARIMWLEHWSTATSSIDPFGFPYMYLWIPRPPNSIGPPSADVVSVHPGKGSDKEAPILAGLTMQQGILPLF